MTPHTVAALELVGAFLIFVGLFVCLLALFYKRGLDVMKKQIKENDDERQSDAGHSLEAVPQAKPGSTHFSRGLQRKVW